MEYAHTHRNAFLGINGLIVCLNLSSLLFYKVTSSNTEAVDLNHSCQGSWVAQLTKGLTRDFGLSS